MKLADILSFAANFKGDDPRMEFTSVSEQDVLELVDAMKTRGWRLKGAVYPVKAHRREYRKRPGGQRCYGLFSDTVEQDAA